MTDAPDPIADLRADLAATRQEIIRLRHSHESVSALLRDAMLLVATERERAVRAEIEVERLRAQIVAAQAETLTGLEYRGG